jgi:hypothetical protein
MDEEDLPWLLKPAMLTVLVKVTELAEDDGRPLQVALIGECGTSDVGDLGRFEKKPETRVSGEVRTLSGITSRPS